LDYAVVDEKEIGEAMKINSRTESLHGTQVVICQKVVTMSEAGYHERTVMERCTAAAWGVE
jgi:hypothetical protein